MVLGMALDLLILDDVPGIGEGLKQKAERGYGLTTRVFTSGIAAFEYLRNLPDDKLPLAYILDMRITTDNPNNEQRELDAPEEIFNYLLTKGKTTFFIYYTGHEGDHDKGVIERTRARMILKPGIEEVEKFLEEVAQAKRGDAEYKL